MKNFGVWLILILFLTPLTQAKIISLNQCGETTITSQGTGGNEEWIYSNDCIEFVMRKNQYNPNILILDKQNQRTFRLLLDGIIEKNLDAPFQENKTPFASQQLISRYTDQLEYYNENISIGYKITNNQIKTTLEIKDWQYLYTNSELWLDTRYMQNQGDKILNLNPITNNITQPLILENHTIGVNQFMSQRLGRGHIILDPIYYIDLDPTPALHLEGGTNNTHPDQNFPTSTDETTKLTDGNHATQVAIKGSPATKVLKLSWNYTYENGSTAFLRFYQIGGVGTDNWEVHPYHNDTHINTSIKNNFTSDYQGWVNINVTQQLIYQRDILGWNYTILRLILNESDTQDVAEAMLLIEFNDTITPTISNCTTSTTNFTCNQSANFTCNITDNIDVSYASYTIDSQSYLANRKDDTFTVTITNNNLTGIKNYAWTDVTACDLFNQCDNTNPSLNVLYNCQLPCTENWQQTLTNITNCNTSNQILQNISYTDLSSCGTNTTLPSNNGTTTINYCNYCDPDWQPLTGGIHDCQPNSTKYVEYIDLNTCYAMTNLTEDAPPTDHQTWQPCTYYLNQFNCTLDTTPFLKKKIEYTCKLPYNNTEWECINTVSNQFTGILQVNPQRTERTTGLIVLSTNLETRETYTTTLGLLNAYYTNKNLIPNSPFILTTTCRTPTQELIHQEIITPQIRPPVEIPNIMIYIRDNAGYLIGLLFLLLITAAMIFGLVKTYRRAR